MFTQLSLGLDEFVVFDFETTGLSPWAGDEVVEIGAVKIFGDEVDEKNAFHSLINPKRLISEEVTRINGITNEMVASAPYLEEVFPKFINFVGNSWLVAQNSRFDMGFMTKYLVQFKMKRQLEVFDTMIMSRRCFPGEREHNLDAICRRLGLKIVAEERHRSIGDVKLTAQAFIRFRERFGEINHFKEKFSI